MTLRGGRYEIIRVIASGGMAKVYLGRALGAGGFERLVALKAMHPHLAAEPEFIDMFLDEARLAARIRHPNVVGTMDVQQDEEGVFLVMEYVEGPTFMAVLKELRRSSRKIPVDIALRIVLDSLAGLNAAHELTGSDGEPLNLIHRDVTPANILLGVDGMTRLTDFGVARAESRLNTTRSGEVKGKIPYLAPEQIRRDEIDRRIDVYSAGAVLWEALAGERLVRGDSDADRLMAILNADRRPLRVLNPEVPEAIETVCLKALTPIPEDRYPTAAAFADALEHAAKASGTTIAARRALGAFIRELKVHESPNELPSNPSKSADAPLSVRAVTTFGTGLQSELEAPVSTHAGAVAAADLAQRPRRKSRVVPAIVGLVVIAAVGAGVLYLRRGPQGHSVNAVENQVIAEPASASAMSAPPEPVPVVSTAGPVLDGVPVRGTEAPPAVSGKDAASASAAVSRPVGGRSTPSTRVPKDPKEAPGKGEPKTAVTGRPAPSPTSFRPKEL